MKKIFKNSEIEPLTFDDGELSSPRDPKWHKGQKIINAGGSTGVILEVYYYNDSSQFLGDNNTDRHLYLVDYGDGPHPALNTGATFEAVN